VLRSAKPVKIRTLRGRYIKNRSNTALLVDLVVLRLARSLSVGDYLDVGSEQEIIDVINTRFSKMFSGAEECIAWALSEHSELHEVEKFKIGRILQLAKNPDSFDEIFSNIISELKESKNKQ
jgi:hypothetical protein